MSKLDNILKKYDHPNLMMTCKQQIKDLFKELIDNQPPLQGDAEGTLFELQKKVEEL